MAYIIGTKLINICMYCNNRIDNSIDVCAKCNEEGFN